VVKERQVLLERYLQSLFQLVFVLNDAHVVDIFHLEQLSKKSRSRAATSSSSSGSDHNHSNNNNNNNRRALVSRNRRRSTISSGGAPRNANDDRYFHAKSSSSSPRGHSDGDDDDQDQDQVDLILMPDDSGVDDDGDERERNSLVERQLRYASFGSVPLIEKVATGVRGFVDASVQRFDRFPSTRVWKRSYCVLKRDTLYLDKFVSKGLCWLGSCNRVRRHTLGDRPRRLRNSTRMGIAFSIEGVDKLGMQLAARTARDMQRWSTAVSLVGVNSHVNGGAPFACAPSPPENYGDAQRYCCGWLLVFDARSGQWKSRYCVLSLATGVLQFFVRRARHRYSLRDATAMLAPIERQLLLTSPSQGVLRLRLKNDALRELWRASLVIASVQPLYAFDLAAHERILAHAAELLDGSAAAASSSSSSALPSPRQRSRSFNYDVQRAIALGRRRRSTSQNVAADEASQDAVGMPATSQQRAQSADARSLPAEFLSSPSSSMIGAELSTEIAEFRADVLETIGKFRSQLPTPGRQSSQDALDGATSVASSPAAMRILCLDGGLLRGLVSSSAAAALEARGTLSCASGVDMLCALSDASFVAVGVAFGFPIECCVRLLELAVRRTVASDSAGRDSLNCARFRSQYFHVLCNEVFGQLRLRDAPKLVAVPLVELSDGRATLRICSNFLDADDDAPPFAAEVVMRSLAWPAMFQCVDYCDGALALGNDPSALAVALAVGSKRATLDSLHVLSIGSGALSVGGDIAKRKYHGALQWAPRLPDLMLASSSAASSQTCARLLDSARLHRIDSAMPPGDMPIDDIDALLSSVRKATEALAATNDLPNLFSST
jgi:hypothetical protein